MIMENNNLILLKASFDRELNPRENEILLKALKADPALQAEAKAMQKIRDLMLEQEVSFGPFFTEKVVSLLGQVKENSFEFAFMRVALPGLIAALILLLITVLGNHSISIDTLMGVETLQPEYLTDFLLYTN